MEFKKIIREKDGKVIEITEWAYKEMKKSSFVGYRDYQEIEESVSIKASKLTPPEPPESFPLKHKDEEVTVKPKFKRK